MVFTVKSAMQSIELQWDIRPASILQTRRVSPSLDSVPRWMISRRSALVVMISQPEVAQSQYINKINGTTCATTYIMNWRGSQISVGYRCIRASCWKRLGEIVLSKVLSYWVIKACANNALRHNKVTSLWQVRVCNPDYLLISVQNLPDDMINATRNLIRTMIILNWLNERFFRQLYLYERDI